MILLEIGEMLKSARESSGVSIEEAASDLHVKSVVLENIENGNIGCFKDIYELKEYLSSYAKYLGLDVEHVLDRFNEYMFEYTSRIPIKDIERQVTQLNKEKETEKVVSPYTKPGKKYNKRTYYFLYGALIVLVIVVLVWSILQIIATRS